MSVFAPGLRLHDRFTLVARIGAGGMSEVWRATDDLLGRQVAIKALIAPLAADPGRWAATWREARAVARLSHPHVTQVHDYGEVPLPGGGTAGYLVMELVQGQTLGARLAAGPLPWPAAVRVAGQVAAALAAAHRLGIVHRDIKPGNVMLTNDGVKVLDFGIAAVAGRVDTDPGRLLGTPGYAAPERFDPVVPVQPASDVYSLGVLLAESLRGDRPVGHRSWAEAAAAHRSAEPVADLLPPGAVSGLPERVVRLCARCLTREPAGRPPAAEVAQVLAEVAAGGPAAVPTRAGPGPATAGRPEAVAAPRTLIGPPAQLEPPPVGEGDPAARSVPGRRGRRLLLTGVAAALVLAGLVVGSVLARVPGEGTDPGAGTGTPAGPAGQPAPGGTAPPDDSTRPAGPAAGPGAGLESAQRVVDDLDRALAELLADGVISGDVHDDLGDELADLREALTEPPGRRAEEVREQAAKLREEIDDRRADGELAPHAADRLAGLLSPLARG